MTPSTNAPATNSHARAEDRVRREEPAIVEKDVPGQGPAVAQVGKRLEHRIVPEQQLQQQRNRCDDLDITARTMFASRKFFDSRAMPTRKPTMVAEHDADRGDRAAF
jgi:hypothetical protein